MNLKDLTSFQWLLSHPMQQKATGEPQFGPCYNLQHGLGKTVSTGKLGLCSVYRVGLDTKTGVVWFFFFPLVLLKKKARKKDGLQNGLTLSVGLCAVG